MKKLLLSLGLGLMAFAGAHADDYVVYQSGILHPGVVEYGWWNAEFNFGASNPSNPGAGQVLEFKAAGTDGYADASMGLNLETRTNTGVLSKATLTFQWYAVGTGTYSIRLTSVSEEDYTFTVDASNAGKWNTMKLNVPEVFPKVSEEWNCNENEGVGYVFSVILSNGKEGDAIYFDKIIYTDINMDWVPATREVAAPETVPTPTQDAEDVLSVFSSVYTPATTFNIGYWGQSTNSTLKEIDGKEVYYLKNFNYLGWELNSDIDISDYDYMHVDFWTAYETPFGFTPISREGSAKEKSIVMSDVVLNEWNEYNIPLKDWADAGLDLSKIFQIKFDQGAGVECYIANVYFWKGEDNGNGDDDDDNNNDKAGAVYKGTQEGTYTQTMSADDIKDYEYVLNYDITYNEDKTLTITGTFAWQEGEPVGATDGLNIVIPGIWVATDGKQGTYYTSDVTFNEGETLEIAFQTAVALGNVESKVNYVVGSSSEENENPGDTTGILTVEESSNVDVYSISGVRVARNVNVNELRNILAPGFYIVDGKKMIVK